MTPVDQNALQLRVVKRMLELIDVRSPWHRSLWLLGTLHAVDEVLECTNATWDGAIANEKAQRYLIERTQEQVRGDVGMGSDVLRAMLATKLGQLSPKKFPTGNQAISQIPLEREIRELAARSKRDYLARWRQHTESGALTPESVERTARLLVAHLLDHGFDQRHIHGWLKSLIDIDPATILVDLLKRGHDMCRDDESEFSFAVVLERGATRSNAQRLESILADLEQVRTELETIADTTPKLAHTTEIFRRLLNQDIAVVVQQSFSARDPHAASAKLFEWMQRIESRSVIGSPRSFRFSRHVLDRTEGKIRNLLNGTASLRVPAMERHSLYAQDLNPQLEASLSLLSSYRSLSPVASVATTWAAVEGLLGHSGAQGIDSADGLAAIVACSFPRAELEYLLDRPMAEPAASSINQEANKAQGSDRARIMLDAILTHGSSLFTEPEDVAAAERVSQVQSDPKATIRRVEGYFKDVFRRLYYQRNFVMHAAKFDSVSLPSTVRSAPKIVAAGLDRVVHAQYVRTPVEPLALASRARNEIEMLGQQGAREVFRLLK
ncbi:hypothetical protein [Paenarthrobacter sp. A20]|uniref:hypothetical protein n=1 Tax=Paenarthrobacter sp. A20 TaxID=2817891 RepID=UPI0020A06DF2|nr:hypothetical protein [Paenarthrobacter sp. A20]MCP1415650.1 hypothetical protein [Paenarthrobacter sp. A20]